MCASWIIYWSGWQTLTTLMVAMLIGYTLVALSYLFRLNPQAPKLEWRAAAWIAPYFIGMLVISYFGDFGSGGIIGGIGIFKHVLDGGNDDLGTGRRAARLSGVEPDRLSPGDRLPAPRSGRRPLRSRRVPAAGRLGVFPNT